MKTIVLLLFLVSALIAQDHILITEVVVTPTENEFIEIYNNSSASIDLSDYYLTDGTHIGSGSYYYNIVTGSNAGGGDGTSDFHARFPAGSVIARGEYQTIALKGGGFKTAFGVNPTYELVESDPAIPNMREAFSGSIDTGGQYGSTLSNAGEVVILYYWDGQTDLVSDVDYYLWGDKAEAVDKTGISIDGPDADGISSTYLVDVTINDQIVSANDAPHVIGESSQRLDLTEYAEITSGGNGISGNNEMSENLAQSFSAGTPNPGTGPGAGPTPPSISVVQINPENPGSSDVVTVSATVTDEGSIVSVQLYTSISDAPFNQTAMTNTSGDIYEAQVDSQAAGTVVKYFILAEDNEGQINQTDTLSYTVSSGNVFTPIADIQNDPSYVGKQVKVQGIVTIGGGVVATDWTKAYIQDNSGKGINIYKSGTPVDPDLVRGNQVIINGTVDEYNGVTEIVDYSVEVSATGQPVPDAVELTTAQANDLAFEGTFIIVKGIIGEIYSAGGGTNISLDDGSGATLIRVWDTAGLNLNSYQAGDTVQIKGVMDIFQSAAQTLLAYQSDIEYTTLGPGEDELVISNVQRTPALPTSADTVNISAEVTAKGTVTRVQLFHTVNWSTYDSTDMDLVSGSTYQASIDSQNTGAEVAYYVKAEDDAGNTVVSATYSYTITEAAGIIPIADIRSNPSYIGTSVTIEGVVTIGSGVLTTDWTDTYVQDNSGRGINVYRFGTPVDADLKRGNLMHIEGTVEEYGGILEITNYTANVLAQNQPMPDAVKRTTNQATDISWEGTYILVKGIIGDLYSAGGGTNIVIDDGSGPVTVRAWDTAGLNFDIYAVGDTVAIKGVIDIYQSTGQILLAYQEDIFNTSFEAAGDGSGIVTVSPTHVDLEETTSLLFTITGNSQDTVATMALSIPSDWTWSESADDVVLSGEAFASAVISVDNKTVNITQTFLANQVQSTIQIQNLQAPSLDTLSIFSIQTAAQGGNLTGIIDQPSVLVGIGTQKVITPISEIQTNIEKWNGKQVNIMAVVTIGAGILITTRTTAYVQDESEYGVQVFSFDPPDKNLVRGNRVLVTGTVEDYEGVTTEITDYTLSVLQEGVELPEPRVLKTVEARNIDIEGSFVEVSGTIIDKYSAGGGTNILVDDGSGEITLRIWDTANLDLTDYNTGDGITARGVIGEFSGTGQILVGYQEDISALQLEKTPLMLRVPNKPFVPDQGEKLPITYSAGSENAHITIRIYDMAGRLIATPVDEIGRSFEQTFEWDGTDQVNEQVTLGAYILILEVVNNSDGSSDRKTAPIVVGTILK